MSDCPVSVVIPAYNAERTIGRVLTAVLAQQCDRPFAVIVVDDGSHDGTAAVVAGFPSVRCVRQDNAGPAAARNRGARESSSEFIAFTDSDCLPRPDWLARLLAGFTSPEIAAVAGSYGIANPQSMLARCVHREIVFRHEVLMPLFPKAFGSYNVCIRRSVFQAVGGFDDRYRQASGEDNDLSYKIVKRGGKIRFDRHALVDHFHPERLTRYLSEQYRHGFWRAAMYRDHPDMARGDDYTFWKDVVEIPGAAACAAGVIAAAACPAIWPYIFILYIVFFALEFYFSSRITKLFAERWYYAGVMILRAGARMAGFTTGVLYLINKKLFKKNMKKI